MSEPTLPEICAKLRQDASDMREILAAWPKKDVGNKNYVLFTRDADIWELAAKKLEDTAYTAQALTITVEPPKRSPCPACGSMILTGPTDQHLCRGRR